MDIFNVAFVVSKNYIGQLKVTLYSLIIHNKDIRFNVHLLHADLNEIQKQDLERFVNSFNSEIRFYQIDESIFYGMPKMQYDASYSAYYKLLLPYFLKNLQKVLFLDCDIIVKGSISKLFQLKHDSFISAVSDYKINKSRKEHVKQIVGDSDFNYFNSGVMLFDFSKSYEIVSIDELKQYMLSFKELIRFHDQDVFNHFYAQNCCFLDEKYNYITTYKSILDVFFPKGKKDAIIIHYANWKPWNENYIGKSYGVYKKYYKMCINEKNVDFMKKRKFSAQLKLIFGYLRRR